MTRFFAGLTVLLVHTAAASAQQFPSAADTGVLAQNPPAPPTKGAAASPPQSQPSDAAPTFGPPAPPPAAAPVPPPAAAPAPEPAQPAPPPAAAAPAPPASPPPQSDDGYPPGYGPPPGYVPPPGYGPRPGAPPSVHYGAPPQYGAPPHYGGPQYGAPPPYSRYPQYGAPPPPPRRVTDRPFTIGGSAGFGGLSLDRGRQSASESGFAYSARLGFGLRPGLLLLWDIERSVVDRGPSAFSQTAHLGALQMFIGNRLFLRAGIGVAQADQDNLFHTGWDFAAMGGIGIELVQGWNWSFDVSSTVTGARYTIAGRDETWLNWSALSFGINFF